MPDPPTPDENVPTEATVEEMLASRLSLASVVVSGASRTSTTLLDRITQPVLSTGGTFATVVEDVSRVVDQLRSTDCYRGVDAYLDTSSSDSGSAAAVFTLSEKSLYQLHTGTTIDTSPGVRRDPSVEASFIWRNLSGQADSLKTSISWMGGAAGEAFAARPTTRTQLDYSCPFALGLNAGVFASLSSSLHNHENNSSHSLSLRSGQVGIDHPFGRLSLNSVWRHVLDVNEHASPLVHQDAGHSWKTSLQQAIEIDRRDSRRMPTRGDMVALNLEATLPIGDARYGKIDASHQLHVPLGASGISMSFFSRFGMLLSQARTSVIDRFYLGGSTSFRGFQNRGIGPRDQEDAVGGDLYYVFGGMFSIPMPESSFLSQIFNARLQTFLTIGDLTDIPRARNSLSPLTTKARLLDRARSTWKNFAESVRITSGLGVALETRVGRIELNYCRVLRSADRDIAASGFQFGISESFS